MNEIRELTQNEIDDVSGGVAPIVVWGAVTVGVAVVVFVGNVLIGIGEGKSCPCQ